MDNTERLEIISAFIEVFEDFLDERGIDVPNAEKEQSPDSASTSTERTTAISLTGSKPC